MSSFQLQALGSSASGLHLAIYGPSVVDTSGHLYASNPAGVIAVPITPALVARKDDDARAYGAEDYERDGQFQFEPRVLATIPMTVTHQNPGIEELIRQNHEIPSSRVALPNHQPVFISHAASSFPSENTSPPPPLSASSLHHEVPTSSLSISLSCPTTKLFDDAVTLNPSRIQSSQRGNDTLPKCDHRSASMTLVNSQSLKDSVDPASSQTSQTRDLNGKSGDQSDVIHQGSNNQFDSKVSRYHLDFNSKSIRGSGSSVHQFTSHENEECSYYQTGLFWL